MRFFNKDAMVIPPKKQNANNKTIRIKSNGYDAIREKLDEHNTMNVQNPVIDEKPKTKVLVCNLN